MKSLQSFFDEKIRRTMKFSSILLFVLLQVPAASVEAFAPTTTPKSHSSHSSPLCALHNQDVFQTMGKTLASAVVVASLAFTAVPGPSFALPNNEGASSMANAKITTGGASTLQSGRTIAITRGVNLDNSDFSNQNLKGVAFQQSIVRDANFENCNLVGASFFDATVDGSNFQNADLSQANFEMAQFNRATLKVRTTCSVRTFALLFPTYYLSYHYCFLERCGARNVRVWRHSLRRNQGH
jgi:uncharacterized protein YjbI with pentapeptide repeats